MKLENIGRKYVKEYDRNDYLLSLTDFLESDKILIDQIVLQNQYYFSETPEESIGFIEEDYFTRMLDKVKSFQVKNREQFFPAENKSIKSIVIKNYGPVLQSSIENVPPDTQWIFLSGENGTGKTNILRALAVSLTNESRGEGVIDSKIPPLVTVELYTNRNEILTVNRQLNKHTDSKQILISGFASYGAFRLSTNFSGFDNKTPKNFRSRSGLTYGLFNTDGILLDLLYKYRKWQSTMKNDVLKERIDNITEVLYDIIPNLAKVEFDLDSDPPLTWYIEEDENENQYDKVPFFMLASGIRSMVAMFGDMMCRLFDQQPYKTDPSELTGIILIDEVDIHLHPKLQRKLVEELSKTFKKIQFIATTHSPIPLLGAPKK